MYYYHIMVPYKDKRIIFFNEPTSPFHVEKMDQVNLNHSGVEELDGFMEDLHIKD